MIVSNGAMSAEVTVDIVVICTECDYSRYLITDCDEPRRKFEGQAVCPQCGHFVVGIPSIREEEASIDVDALVRSMRPNRSDTRLTKR